MKELKGKKSRWIHFKKADKEALDFLSKNFKFHILDLEDVKSNEYQRPKVDIYKYYLFFIAVFPHFNKKTFKIEPKEVDFFITDGVLITINKNNNSFLEHIFERVEKSAKLKKMWLEKGPGFLFYKIIERLFYDSKKTIQAVEQLIGKVEEDVYSKKLKDVARDLAYIQRCVLMLRRIIEPQRLTLETLINLKQDYFPADLSDYFGNVHDYIEKTWAEINLQRYTIDSLHRTNETMISHNTSRIITVLAVIEASLMPPTLLTGIYGMNLSHLAWANEPAIVFSIFGLVAILTLFLVILIFKFKNN